MSRIKRAQDKGGHKKPQDSRPTPGSMPRQSAFGHPLDGSQQLDILEEHVYANADDPARDQPIVPPKPARK